MRVVEAARDKVAFAGAIELGEPRITLARLPFPGIGEQVHLARQAGERSHHGAARIFDDEFRNEIRVGEVRKRVVEALARVHAAQRVEVGFGVGANVHGVKRSKDSMAQQGVCAGDGFGGVKCSRSGFNAVRCERRLRRFRNRRLRERVRQRLESRVVLERKMRAFVGFYENENCCRFIRRGGQFIFSLRGREREPM